MTNTPLDRDIEELERLAYWLDERFRIPGTNVRIGLDGLLGVLPGIGDGVTLAMAGYLVARARRLGLPNSLLARLVFNLLLDTGIGAIPVIGDIFDVGFKSNRRNVDLVTRHLRQQRSKQPQSVRSDETALS